MARNSSDKSKLVSILSETPFIDHACKKVGLPRMTFYRWLKSDYDFKAAVTAAIREGRERMDEVAESALMKNIQSGKSSDIQFYLTHNHHRYKQDKARDKKAPQLSPEEVRELRTIIGRNRPIPKEHMDRIIATYKRYGFVDEKGNFNRAFYDWMHWNDDQIKELQEMQEKERKREML